MTAVRARRRTPDPGAGNDHGPFLLVFGIAGTAMTVSGGCVRAAGDPDTEGYFHASG